MFWKEVDLDGSRRVFLSKAKDAQGCVAYLKFVPVKSVSAPVPQDLSLIATNDAYWMYDTVDDVFEMIYPFKDTSVKKLFFCVAHGDTCRYMPTRIGNQPKTHENQFFSRKCDRVISEKGDALMEKEPNILSKICDFTHKIGLEFHTSCRMEAFTCQPPFDTIFVTTQVAPP